jgi:hypothetical protein
MMLKQAYDKRRAFASAAQVSQISDWIKSLNKNIITQAGKTDGGVSNFDLRESRWRNSDIANPKNSRN